MIKWTLKGSAQKRFLQGHPWVFANELDNFPGSAGPGDWIHLYDHMGNFLAAGFGNPKSLIAFRIVTTQEIESPEAPEVIAAHLAQAYNYRKQMGVADRSHRMAFAEADFVPGVVVDLFKSEKLKTYALSFQLSSAGAVNTLGDFKEFFPLFVDIMKEDAGIDFSESSVVVRHEASGSSIEGFEPKTFVFKGDEEQLKKFPFVVDGVTFTADLIHGQKTGFFFDQVDNVLKLKELLSREKHTDLKVLDLFCYVGQWSTHLAHWAKENEIPSDVFVIDASKTALAFAESNASQYTNKVTASPQDIIEKAKELPKHTYDVTICDPPALIKTKKDYHPGKAAYTKVMSAALATVKPGGYFVASSCSHHLSNQDFEEVLSSAERKSKKNVRWLYFGGQSLDHPVSLLFPQGRYLKTWIGKIAE